MWVVFAQQKDIIVQLLGKCDLLGTLYPCWAKIFRHDIVEYCLQKLPNKIEICISEMELSLLTKFGKGKIEEFLGSYSSTSLVRASVVRGPSVVRGFEWPNFSSH